MATHKIPNPASRTLRRRFGFSARRWARRDTGFLLREAERVPELREREDPLRLVEDFRWLLFLERDCAMLNNTPLLHSI